MRILLLISFAALTFASAASAQSALGFNPQRIIIPSGENSSQIMLTNRGDRTTTFRIELIDVLYKDDGTIEFVEAASEDFPSARPHIRFSPRQVRLDPGESQRVRVLVRSRVMSDGEYRVHARLSAVPDRVEAAQSAAEGTVVGAVNVNQAVAIPVILRRGETSATGSIELAQFVDGRSAIEAVLSRRGNRSLYLDLRLFRGGEAEGEPVALVRGVAVPVPNQTRRFRMGLPEAMAAGAYTLEIVDNVSGQRIATQAVN